jgi:hypothetical protein
MARGLSTLFVKSEVAAARILWSLAVGVLPIHNAQTSALDDYRCRCCSAWLDTSLELEWERLHSLVEWGRWQSAMGLVVLKLDALLLLSVGLLVLKLSHVVGVVDVLLLPSMGLLALKILSAAQCLVLGCICRWSNQHDPSNSAQ